MPRKRTPRRDPAWTGSLDAPHVLIEERDGALSWAEAHELRRAGYAVATCDGPVPARPGTCSLAQGGRCHLAEEADLILCDVADGPEGDAVLRAHRRSRPERPVLRTATHRAPGGAPLPGIISIDAPLFPGDLTTAVEDALS